MTGSQALWLQALVRWLRPLVSWLRTVAYHVVIVFALTFLGALLSEPAGFTHLNSVRAAAVAGLSAALAVVYASLRQLHPAAARALRRMTPRARADAASIKAATHARFRIAIVVQTVAAATSRQDVETWLPGLRRHMAEFCHHWGLLRPELVLRYAGPHKAVPAAGYDLLLTVLDDSDQAHALGYHDDTAGGPYARVFARDCEDAGVSVSSCIDHELLEAIADLACDRWAQTPDGRLYALEVCDPVESDVATCDGVDVSNYVLPAWFDSNAAGPYDALGTLDAPFTLSDGGYAVVQSGGNVTQIYGNRAHYNRAERWRKAMKKTPLSRTARRLATS